MENSLFDAGEILLEIIGSAVSIGMLFWLAMGPSSQLSILTANFIRAWM